MALIIIAMLFRLYIWLQQALFVSIDNDIPYYQTEWLLPISDVIYRLLRVVGCICVFFTIKWLLPYWIGLYILAWLFKKVMIYLTYSR